jgi:pimeloyl-ACP methyl ester carboxylesterase
LNKVYFISGLGADKRVFSFLDLAFCEPVFIDWITPEANESLQNYALRLRKIIPEENPCIVGISLGGMLVTEMANADSSVKAIIIASNKTSDEFPAYLRTGSYFPIYKWTSASIAKSFMLRSTWILGGKTSAAKTLLQQILMDSDIEFVRWAIGAILQWKNKEIPRNLIHIHGTADKLLPYRYVKADHTIQDGTHLLPLDNPAELSDLLKKLI